MSVQEVKSEQTPIDTQFLPLPVVYLIPPQGRIKMVEEKDLRGTSCRLAQLQVRS